MSQKNHQEVKTASTAGTTTAVAADEEQEESEPRKYLSLRSAAIKVLSDANAEGLSPKEIYATAVAEGFVDPIRKGKTPQATLAATFYTEIENKKDKSTFIKVGKGRFTLNPNIGADDDNEKADSNSSTSSSDKKALVGTKKKEGNRQLRQRGRVSSISPNTHAKGKTICGVKQKTKNGQIICRIPWTGEKHEGEHKFEPFRRK